MALFFTGGLGNVMLNKEKVYNACLGFLNSKIFELKKALKELTEEAGSDSKSSAGDKHETSRAMMQIEQERIIRQKEKFEEQLAQLEKMNLKTIPEKIVPGSLILTTQGYFFLSIALGKIEVEGTTIYVLSPASPLGAKLSGLKKGDAVKVNNAKYEIEELS
jgi:hypothetical protein